MNTIGNIVNPLLTSAETKCSSNWNMMWNNCSFIVHTYNLLWDLCNQITLELQNQITNFFLVEAQIIYGVPSLLAHTALQAG